MRYVDLIGRVNRELASRFDCVCELVCGIPLVIKGFYRKKTATRHNSVFERVLQ
jgi:hypothetical protein